MAPPYDIELVQSDGVQEMAITELRETPEIREQALEELRRLLHEATDLHYRDDDEFLTIFLRACHYYPESAMKMFRKIAEFKKQHTSLLKDLMPEDERESFINYDVVNVLKNRDQKGRRVLIVNCGEVWDPKAVTSESLFRLFYLIHLIAQLEPDTQVRGVVVIMDFRGLSMKQIKALSPTFSMRLLSFIQEAMPLRMKEIHMINQPFIFKMVWAMFKPFIREKLGKRIFFHGGDRKNLHQYLDPDFLPGDYGGNLPAIDYTGKEWYPCVKNYEDHISKWSKFGFADQHN